MGDPDYGVLGRLFSPNGKALSHDFRLNTALADWQYDPALTTLTNGNILASWTDLATGGVMAQILTAKGAAQGAAFALETTTRNVQMQSAVSALKNGGFVAAWLDPSNSVDDASGTSAVRAQVFGADGTRLGAEFLVNTSTVGEQKGPQIAPSISAMADGRFVVVWTDGSGTGGDSDQSGIRAQVFDPREAAVRLVGGKLADQFLGTEWNDTLSGGAGADRLLGAAGDDVLAGGKGADRLNGGEGGDRFVFANKAAAQGDRIIDFTQGEDMIDLSAFMDGGRFIGPRAFKKGVPDQVRYDGKTGLLSGDLNGDGRADWTLTLANKAALTVADFLF